MAAHQFNPLKNLKYDLPAALVVFLVALPLCLGVALASGAPPFAGIIAGAVGGIVIGALSKSPLSVSGPAAGLTTIVLAAIQQLPTFETFLLAVFLAGIIQVVLGILRAGIIGDFIPSSVIKGMLAAIGIILILKQIPHAVGYDKDYEGDFGFAQLDGENTFSELWHLLDNQFTSGAIIISVVSLLFLFWWDGTKLRRQNRLLQMLPGPLVVVLFSVLANQSFGVAGSALLIGPEHLVSLPRFGSAADFFALFRFPDFSMIGQAVVWKIALTIGLVASMETLLSIEAIDKLDPFKRLTPTNRELWVQGVGNMTSGLLGGMPVTSVIVRSSANVDSGARTQASSIVHGLLLLLCAIAIPGLLNKIPLSALAAILIAIGYKLTKPAIFIQKYKKGWSHLVPFLITILAILFTDLLTGVLIGLVIGAFFIVFENYKSGITIVHEENRYLLRFRKDLSFIHKFEVKQALRAIPDNTSVFIDLSKTSFVDLDNVEIIIDFAENARHRGITVEYKISEGHPAAKHFLNG